MSYVKVAGVTNLYRRGERFYLKRKLAGRVSWEPLRATTKSDAKLEIADFVTNRSSKTPTKRNIRFTPAFDRFIEVGHGSRRILGEATKEDYQNVVEIYGKPIIGTMRVADVEPDDILRVREFCLRASESRWRHVYVALNSFFQKVTEPGEQYVRPDNPVRGIGFTMRPKQPEITPIDDEAVIAQEDADAIGAHCHETIEGFKTKMMFVLLYECGLRASEIVVIQRGDVRYATGALHATDASPSALFVKQQLARRPKADDPTTWFSPLKGREDISGSEQRVVGLSPYAARMLGEYIARGEKEGWLHSGAEALLFPNSKQRPIRTNHLWSRLQDAAERAGVRKVTTHWFRHTFASNLIDRGVDIRHVRDALGHSSEKVTEKRYAHRGANAPYIAAVAKGGRQ